MSTDFLVIPNSSNKNICTKCRPTQTPVKLFLQFISVFIITILIL